MALAKRIIPCLDVKNGKVVKGLKFGNLVDVGDPAELASYYCQAGADEICFLDIAATNEGRKTLLDWVKKTAENIDVPLLVGGGVATVWDFTALMRSGADKVCINTAAFLRPQLVAECSREYGSQAVVAAIDYKKTARGNEVFINAGNTPTGCALESWAKKAVKLGAGEVLATSIDCDGTNEGFDIGALSKIADGLGVPVIASGGAGRKEDFLEVFSRTGCTGALAAGAFHRNEIEIPTLKAFLKKNGVEVRC